MKTIELRTLQELVDKAKE